MNRLLRRLAQVLVTLGIVTGLGVATGGVAQAYGIGEYACKYVVGQYNACLMVTNLGAGWYHVYIGIDVAMSQQEAQYRIATQPWVLRGGTYGVLLGDDGSHTRQVLNAGLDSLPSVTSWSGGLSASWNFDAPGSALDEDNGIDELVGQILYLKVPGVQVVTYETGQVVGAF